MNKIIPVLVISALLLSGCADSSKEEVPLSAYEAKKQRINKFQAALENWLRDAKNPLGDNDPDWKDNFLINSCSDTRKSTLNFLSQLAMYNDEFKALGFDKIGEDNQFTFWTQACNTVLDERPGLREKSDSVLEKNQMASDKLQQELDVLDKKANKLGGGSYSEMLDALSDLESLIEQGAEYSLTGQGRNVENASCEPTTYSRWSQGAPGGKWYCYLEFLDGDEPYTINVDGTRWGGKADRGSSAGSFVNFKVSSELKEWLSKWYE